MRITLIFYWIKCNIDDIDEASIVIPSKTSCGGMFMDYNANHIGTFACYLDHGNALFVELKRTTLKF